MAVIRNVPALLDIQLAPGDDLKRTFIFDADLSGFVFTAQSDGVAFSFQEQEASTDPGKIWELVITAAQSAEFFSERSWSLSWVDLNGDARTICAGRITPVDRTASGSTSTVYVTISGAGETVEIALDAARGEPGPHPRLIFKVAATQPDTPTGNTPSGWYDAPQDGLNWVSRGYFTPADVLIGTWSAPTRWGWATFAFAAFGINTDSGHLDLNTPDEYTGPNFDVAPATGHLEVIVQ